MRASEGLAYVHNSLSNLVLDDACKESEIIITEGLGIERVSLYRDDPELSASQIRILGEILIRRAEREPIQYIIGHIDFCGMDIKVGPGVLIPRPETELLVETAIEKAASGTRNSGKDLDILDLCTGSGCIALALGKSIPHATVYATDISAAALTFASENSRRNGIGNVMFLRGNLYDPLNGRKFDLIVSNPPYVNSSDIDILQPEISYWEPMEALDGGEDGLFFYGRILSLAGNYLKDGGAVLLETGEGRAKDVIGIGESFGLGCKRVIRDYAGIERVLVFAMKAGS
jgi:release factor glutamine methyltransferase